MLFMGLKMGMLEGIGLRHGGNYPCRFNLTFTTIDFLHEFKEEVVRQSPRYLLNLGADDFVARLFIRGVGLGQTQIFIQLLHLSNVGGILRAVAILKQGK